ncbi:outer membrane protein assembly factor BamB family protein [Natrialba asiatica]|uniref:Serine/threonine protein kinase-like protein n=1 Tax=Natrialba asiatica (strain ATCC 700177 / DSM 12278 / JCM 9576 / FERM P-10747 / NBRC 102637 / 172P1) TaxID=29540 RepID=M0APS8_NATA1|nr:PQQ-binding-like beta-propeller repeat protein [Natrialba asiatica]ELY99393.1 serine/threonine protein kinase-like protein [Natrialba asiatica DSM 12278]
MPSTRRSFLATCTIGCSALAGCFSTADPAAEGSWSRRTLGNAHTGRSTTNGPTTDLYTAWNRERPDSGVVNSSPVVEDGTLYHAYSQEAMSDEPGGAWVEAFDAATGDSEWTTELFRTNESYYFYHSDSMVVDGDRLFVQTKPGLAMLTTDGEHRWTVENLYENQQTPDVVTPVVTDDIVVCGTYGSGIDEQNPIVYGVDPETGAERWRTTLPEWGGMWQLSASEEVVYVPSVRQGLIGLDLATGEEQWRWEGPISGTPTVVDDLLVFALRNEDENQNEDENEFTLAAMDRHDRSLRWQVPIGSRWADAGLSVADGCIYLETNFGVEARRLETGERVWRFGGDQDDYGKSSSDEPLFSLAATPVVSGDAVYAPGYVQRETTFGHLFVIDADTGEELDRIEMGRNEKARAATPAVTSDLVFLTANHGTLYAFGECESSVAGRCLRG